MTSRGDDGVAGVGGAALRRVHRRGVGQVEVFGDVGGGQQQPHVHGLAVGAGGGGEVDFEGAVVADGGDLVGLAVDRTARVPVDPGQVPAVPAGLHAVANPGDRPLGERDAVQPPRCHPLDRSRPGRGGFGYRASTRRCGRSSLGGEHLGREPGRREAEYPPLQAGAVAT